VSVRYLVSRSYDISKSVRVIISETFFSFVIFFVNLVINKLHQFEKLIAFKVFVAFIPLWLFFLAFASLILIHFLFVFRSLSLYRHFTRSGAFLLYLACLVACSFPSRYTDPSLSLSVPGASQFASTTNFRSQT
jgi:magnesium-transporting ATPase (P-type)